MKKLYKFTFNYGRMGSLQGLFVAEEDDLLNLIGTELYFGEALGKHSEVYGPLEAGDVNVLSEDQEKIEWLVDLIGSNSISGYNPFDYAPEEDEEEE